ncbi:MAG: hypothetical protein KDJ51_08320, partial [Nitratireductor sp.]|nr:hypothetical protein [Nitratireductor sp.]
SQNQHKKNRAFGPVIKLEGTINKPSRGEQLIATVAGRRKNATAHTQLSSDMFEHPEVHNARNSITAMQK